MSNPVPFGSWSPTLSGLIPTMPPAALIDPPVALVIFSYLQLKAYRMWHQPYIVQVHYDLFQRMIDDGIEKRKAQTERDWLEFIEFNL